MLWSVAHSGPLTSSLHHPHTTHCMNGIETHHTHCTNNYIVNCCALTAINHTHYVGVALEGVIQQRRSDMRYMTYHFADLVISSPVLGTQVSREKWQPWYLIGLYCNTLRIDIIITCHTCTCTMYVGNYHTCICTCMCTVHVQWMSSLQDWNRDKPHPVDQLLKNCCAPADVNHTHCGRGFRCVTHVVTSIRYMYNIIVRVEVTAMKFSVSELSIHTCTHVHVHVHLYTVNQLKSSMGKVKGHLSLVLFSVIVLRCLAIFFCITANLSHALSCPGHGHPAGGEGDSGLYWDWSWSYRDNDKNMGQMHQETGQPDKEMGWTLHILTYT